VNCLAAVFAVIVSEGACPKPNHRDSVLRVTYQEIPTLGNSVATPSNARIPANSVKTGQK
jgi:energy-converting hydrogenase Eha subunit E